MSNITLTTIGASVLISIIGVVMGVLTYGNLRHHLKTAIVSAEIERSIYKDALYKVIDNASQDPGAIEFIEAVEESITKVKAACKLRDPEDRMPNMLEKVVIRDGKSGEKDKA